MDPVTALGVAAATVQFISFAGDVLSKSREIYLSADGALLTQNELDTIAKSFRSLCTPFKYWDPAHGLRRRPNPTELRLKDLCKGCVRVAEDLENALEKLKVHGAHHRKWKSFRQALNSVKSDDEIEKLQARLAQYRAQIDTTLLFILREKIDNIEEKQSLSSAEISKSVLGTVDDNKKWQADLIKSVHQQQWDHRDNSNIEAFSVLFSRCTDSQRKKFIEADILRRLHFQTMDDRHDRIPEAYRNTFEWVFREPTTMDGEKSFDSYLQWLRGPEPVYWITGKPGAGKSTLMKYMFNDVRTRQHAASWSGKAELISAGYFFWNSGTELQMSRDGLLQTLLYQNYEQFGGDIHDNWRWSDLVKFFKKLISVDTRKYIFFIDGLDEFAGDHTELVNFILEISKFTNVKLCVASRPWLAFEEAFGKRPRLKVEMLTRSDIERFISEKLQTSQRYLALKLEEPSDAKLLIDEVTGKAHGVFLWVYLVVRSLQEGLRDGDTMKDLLVRISLLPSDLEELFRKILDRLDTFYFQQASILFQLMDAAAPKPLPVIQFAFAEDGFEAALKAGIKPLSQGQLSSRAESVRRRLNSRSKGLLEATPVKSNPELAQVQYLHRTVKDFLSRRDIWTHIISGTDSSFNASVTLCGTYLLQLKKAQLSKNSLAPLWDSVRGCIDHACRAEEVLHQRQIQFLDEVDRAATIVLKGVENLPRITRFKVSHWADTLVSCLEGEEDCRVWLDCYPFSSFVEYAASRGLYHYIENKISTGAISRDHILKSRTLLCAATQRKDDRLIRYLLEKKADPNMSGKQGTSAWQQLLQLLDSSYFAEPEVWYELVTLFLDHGADPEAVVHGSPAFSILETAFGGWDFDQTKQLLQGMLATRKSLRKRKDWPKALFKQRDAKHLYFSAIVEHSIGPVFVLPDWADGK